MACNNFDEDLKEHNAEAAVLLCWMMGQIPVFATTPPDPKEAQLRRWWAIHQNKDKADVQNRLNSAQRLGYSQYVTALTSLSEYERNLVFGPR
jgi:hypothetical protein